MPQSTITFAVNGSLSLQSFALAMRRFTDLVDSLNRETGVSGEVDWILDDLEYGSAIATARAVPKDSDDATILERVQELIDSYLAVGQALESASTVPFSPRVQRSAGEVRRLLDTREGIESIRFETEADDVTIQRVPASQPLPSRSWPYSYGGVEGRVQTLSSRGRLRFTLFDLSEERAVSCYLDEALDEPEELMKGIWGRIAVVEGRIRRDPRTGRPQVVRNVRRVTPLPEPDLDLYRNARGALKLLPGQMTPEDAIRRIRNA